MPASRTPRTTRKSAKQPLETPRTTRQARAPRTPLPSLQGVRKRKRILVNRWDIRPYSRDPESYEASKDANGCQIYYCNQRLPNQDSCSYSSAVATNFRKHLRTRHSIELLPSKPSLTEATERGINEMTRSTGNPESQGPRTPTLTEESMRTAVVHLIVRRSLPLNAIEWPEIHCLLLLANPEIRSYLATCRRTLMSDISQLWATKKNLTKGHIQNARTQINISLDIWTSPNNCLFLGVVGHYVRAEENTQSTSLLALRQIGGHSGREQFSVLCPILEEYNIVRKLGYIIADNASTNSSLCRTVSQYLSDEHSIEWDPERNQIRCIGHILNLIVQSFLFRKNKDEEILQVEEELRAYDDQELEQLSNNEEAQNTILDQQQHVRDQLRCLGKLHNIVVHIRSSAGRTKEFEDMAGKRIPLDNRTRWNSWFTMIERGLELERHIDFYLKLQPELNDDVLDQQDWDNLRTISQFLQRFRDFTKQLERQTSDISQVLPMLLHVRIWINAFKHKFSSSPYETEEILTRVEMAEIAWKKWWMVLWQNPIYPLAVFLNPAYRTKWFQEARSRTKGESTRIQEGLNHTKQLWQAWHEEESRADSHIRTDTAPKALAKRRRTTFGALQSIYDMDRQVFGDWQANNISEYDDYSNQPVIAPPREFSPLAWWCEPSQQAKWPHLSRLAVRTLSFPAMSAEPERVFSGARRTISWDRSSLSAKTIEVLECLKYSLRTEQQG